MRLKHMLRAAAVAALLSVPAAAQELVNVLGPRVTGVRDLAVLVPKDSGAVRIDAYLDGRKVESASVDGTRALLTLDFGAIPFARNLTFSAYDARNQVTGTSTRRINGGGRDASIDIIRPYAQSGAQEGTPALACVHVPEGTDIDHATLESGVNSSPLVVVKDNSRCNGITLAGNLPAVDSPYLSARVMVHNGGMFEKTIQLEHYSAAFGEELTIRMLQYLVRPLDKKGDPVMDLNVSQFHVNEDRKELPIQYASLVRDTPLDLAIVLDRSESTIGDKALEVALKEGALSLFDPARDRVIIYLIGNEPVGLIPKWTNDRAAIEEALATAVDVVRTPPSETTAAFDTLEQVLYEFQSGGVRPGSAGAILYMTDGWDTVSGRNTAARQEQLVRYAKASGVQIYPISILTPLGVNGLGVLQVNNVGHKFLDDLAMVSGGERTAVTLDANPDAFRYKIERLRTQVQNIDNRLAEMMQHYLELEMDTRFLKEEYDEKKGRLNAQIALHESALPRQEMLAKLAPPLSEHIRTALVHVETRMRTQYVIGFQADATGKPRERRLSFSVDDPRVVIVKAPTGAHY